MPQIEVILAFLATIVCAVSLAYIVTGVAEMVTYKLRLDAWRRQKEGRA